MAKLENKPGRQSLVDAAERLIATRGFHGVAAREVVKEAGHKNNSAIAYHFGSWDALLDAVWAEHAEPVNAARKQMIDAAGDDADLTTLVGVYVQPIADEVARLRPSYWARFNEQWLASTTIGLVPDDGSAVSSQHTPQVEALFLLGDLLEDIRRRLTWLSAEHARRRVGLMCRFVIVALAAAEREAQPPDWTEFADELVSVATAMLRSGQ